MTKGVNGVNAETPAFPLGTLPPMIVRFDAALFESGLDEGGDPYFYVFVADATNSHYLDLQRARPLDAADPATDEDDAPFDEEDEGIYIEVDGQGFSDYECISLFELSPTGLRVQLARPLGGQVTGVEIAFPAAKPPPQFLDHLRSIFFERESLLRIALAAGPTEV